MIQFFAPDIQESNQLPEVESQHCIKVLRMKQGDKIFVTDGKGYRYSCTIIDPNPKHVYLNINSKEFIPNHWNEQITIAIAPTKNMDRMEWFAEKSTEIGINAIIPIKCSHSERKELKIERINKILVSATKQSLKTTIPQLSEMIKFAEFVKQPFDGQKFIAYCDEPIEKKNFIKEYIASNNVLILIGPEGDFTPEEVSLAIENGFIPVTFGNSRLRTETAALFAVAAIQTINQLK